MNKIILRAIISLLLLTLLMIYGCQKKEINTNLHLVAATDPTWPPMEMIKNGKIVGFDIDLLELAAEKGGFTVEFIDVAWDEIFTGLQAGEYDAVISSVEITATRKKIMDFSIPYINAGEVLLVRSETGEIGLANLRGEPIGIQIGTPGLLKIEKVKGITLEKYSKLDTAIEDLVSGRIEAVLTDMPIAADYAYHNNDYDGKLRIAGDSLVKRLYGIAVKKGNTEVRAALNRGLKRVLQEGLDRVLMDRWLR